MDLLEKWEEKRIIHLLDIHKPCDINAQAEIGKETALHLAAKNGWPQLVEVLVEKCYANVNVRNSNGKTPLDAARISLSFQELPGSSTIRSIEYAKVVKYLESIDQSDSGAMVKRGALEESKSESCKMDSAVL